MILVCVAGVASLLEGAPLPSRSVASVASVASTRVGQIRPQRLPDGSVVTLDTDSRIAFTLTAHNRIVRLVHGRARFDVAHNPARPFVVEAGGQTVTATGTVFDVALYGENLRVTLLRGSVDVAQGLARRREYVAITRLRPGEVMQATHSQPVPRITSSARGEDQWVDGMLSFKATRLSEVLAQTNRYATAKIQLAEPSLADLRVTGAVHPVPVDHLAASLAAAFFLRAETLPNGSIVLHAR
jgi:transmembrane sensor